MNQGKENLKEAKVLLEMAQFKLARLQAKINALNTQRFTQYPERLTPVKIFSIG